MDSPACLIILEILRRTAASGFAEPGNNFGTSRPDLIMQSQLRYKNLLLSAGGNLSQFNFNAFTGNGNPALVNNNQRVTSATVQKKEVSINGEIALGQTAWLNLGGTVAQARVIPASQLIGKSLPDEWQTSSVTISAGRGISVVKSRDPISTFGQPESFKAWVWRDRKTPWRGKLSVGRTISTAPHNPFKGSDNNPLDNGAVPFVKYEVDL